jgi:uncharacterized protein (DUF2141 family)
MIYLKLFFVFLISFFQTDSNIGSVKLTISNIEEKKGFIRIGIYNSADKFPEKGKAFKNYSLKVDNNTILTTISNLPSGYYSIALYHDENLDKECNLNFIGIPKEGIGFSNNIKPITSAPSFDETKFYVKTKSTSNVNIKLIHY